MKIRKGTFFITVNAQNKHSNSSEPKTFIPQLIRKNGYIVTMFDAEMAEPFEIGVYKRDNMWIVTCLLTGYMICQAKTRKAALERFELYYMQKYRAYIRRNDSAFRVVVGRFNELLAMYVKGAN